MIYRFLMFVKRIYWSILNYSIKKHLKSCGTDVYIDENVTGMWENISIGSDVHIGKNNLFMCLRAPIIIQDHVMFGPNVTMITGDHRIDIIGRYMTSIKNDEKLEENDQPIFIEGDNWIGANVTVLKGVKIGEGAVVASGSVVTRNVEPYSIVGGVPARHIKYRFDKDEIKRHKAILNL